MRKLFVAAIGCIILLAACGGGHGRVTVKGEFKNLQDGEFYLFSTDPAWGSFDTIHITDGSFEFSHDLEDTVLVVVQYPNFMQMQLVAIPGKTITIKGDANNLLTTRISGSEENELLTDFRRSTVKKSNTEVLRLAEKFIRSHPANFASQVVLEKYFVNVKDMDYTKILSLLSLMRKKVPDRMSLNMLSARLKPLCNTAKGKLLPAFSAVTMDGKKVNNATLKGKNSLITFWSTWSQELMNPVRDSRRILRPYLKDLKIVNISLDADTIQTRMYVKTDSIPGMNVCDCQSWRSPLVRVFGVRYLPSNILLNAQGRIVGRDLEESALLSELKKLSGH